jgi:hypothetical protein
MREMTRNHRRGRTRPDTSRRHPLFASFACFVVLFPRTWCEQQKIPAKVYDSIINKTPISYKANRMIGGDAPSIYLERLQKHKQVQIEDAAMDAILDGHCIPSEALRADDFEAFYRQRKQRLLHIIEQAMGKKVLLESGAQAVPA